MLEEGECSLVDSRVGRHTGMGTATDKGDTNTGMAVVTLDGLP